jgi:predicted DNA-binding protein
MDKKTILVRHMPVSLWQRLKAQAAVEGRLMHQIVAEAIQQYLDKPAKAA